MNYNNMNIDFLDNDNLDKEEELEDQVECHLSTGNYNVAIEVLKSAEKQYPWKTNIKKQLARVYLIKEDYALAMKIIETLNTELSADSEILAILSIIYRIYYKNSLIADKYEQQAFQSVYDKEDVYFFICDIFYKLYSYNLAYKYVKKALKYNKDDSLFWDYRSGLEHKLNKYYAMEKCLNRELSISPALANDYNFNIYQGLCLAYYYSGRFEKAIKIIDKYSVEYFDDNCTLIVMSQIYRLYNNDNKAKAILEYVFANRRMEFLDIMEIIILGKINHTIVDISEQIKTFNFIATYIRQLVNSENPIIRKGIKLLFDEDYESAVIELQECVTNDTSPVLRVTIAYALFHSGKVNEVITWLDDAISKNKDKYIYWFYFSFITDYRRVIEYIKKFFKDEINRIFLDSKKILGENINIYKKQVLSKETIKKTIDCYRFLVKNDSVNEQLYKRKIIEYIKDINERKHKHHECKLIQMRLF